MERSRYVETERAHVIQIGLAKGRKRENLVLNGPLACELQGYADTPSKAQLFHTMEHSSESHEE